MRLLTEIGAATRKTVESFLTVKYLERDQQRKYAALLENTTDFVAILDDEFRFTFLSPSIARMSDSTVEEMIGRSSLGFADAQIFREALRSLAPHETRTITVETGPTQIGELTIEVTMRNMVEDPLIGGWLVNGRDVTDGRRKAAVEHEAVLRRSEIAALSTAVANASPETFGDEIRTHLRRFIELIAADRCLIWIADQARGALDVSVEAAVDGVKPVSDQLPSFDLNTVKLMTGKERVMSTSDLHHEELENFIRIDSAPPIGASSFFPLRSGGQLVGLMLILRFRVEAFDDDANLHAMAFADTVAAALNRRATIELLEVQALSDSLTGLGNRRELSHALGRAVRDVGRSGGVGMLYCDVDSFKLVNDSFGHDVGDEFLQETARRIRAASRSTDTIVRLGGDEFVVLLDGVQTADDAFHYAKHLRRALMEPMTISGRNMRPSFCMGVSFGERSEIAADPALLISHADLALLEAKRAGGGEIWVFDADLLTGNREELRLVDELDQGINRSELVVFYQPIVDLRDHRRIVSVEGLVRWNHPTRGLVFPDVFIPVAEKNKMITRITSAVLAQGLHGLASARDAGTIDTDTSLAVNVSVRDLRSKDFLLRVERALEYSGLQPSLLHVELTESSAIDDQRVFGALLGLRHMGVQIAIDDFGTGYASLSYLRDVPASLVKIDRSFVQQMDDRRDRSLIAAAIAMSHKLDMEVVAEGVETQRQAAELLDMGCDYGQGYLFARPTPDLMGLRQTLRHANVAPGHF